MMNNRLLANVSILYIVLLAMFSRYTEHYAIWKIVGIIFFIIWFTKSRFRKGLTKNIFSKYSAILLFTIIGSATFGSSIQYLMGNLKLFFWPLFFICFITTLYFMVPEYFINIFEKIWFHLNIMYIVNLIVLAIQCEGIPIFIKDAWIDHNSFYPDLCCGLFGLNGTHDLTLFAIFMNIYILHKSNEKKGKIGIIVYLCVSDIILLYFSTKNDNVSIFLLLPFMIAMYWIFHLHFNGERVGRTALKLSKYVIPAIIILIVLINIPFIKSYFDEYIYIRVNMLFRVTDKRYLINGSNERLAVFLTAIQEYRGWLFGRGLGSADLGGGEFWGFNHFGLSSIGSFTMLGGIWFFLSLSFMYVRMLHYSINEQFNMDFYSILIFVVIFMFTVYTILFTSFVSMIWLCLTFMIIGINRTNYVKQCKLKELKTIV